MNRKLIGGIIIISGALLLGLIVYFVFMSDFSLNDLFSKFTKDESVQEEIDINNISNGANNTDSTDGDNNIKVITVADLTVNEEVEEVKEVKLDPIEASREDLKRMAGSFSERYGSYSNHSNFSNIIDLKIFMSKRMKTWADTYIASQKAKDTSNVIYYGITTKVVAEDIVEYDDDLNLAEILVQTRRREAIGSTNNVSEIFNQNILVTFVKEAGAWKVDSANWQDK